MTEIPAPRVNKREPDKKSGMEQLQKLLDSGPDSLSGQIRYLMAISQVNGMKSRHVDEKPHLPDVRQARLSTLADLAEVLDEARINTIIEEVMQLEDPAFRLPLMVRLALNLSPQNYRSIVHNIWHEVKNLANPEVYARTLFELAPMLLLVNDEPATASSLLQVISEAQALKNREARLRSLIALAPRLPQDLSMRIFRRILNELKSTASDSLRTRAIIALAPDVPDDLIEPLLGIVTQIKNAGEQAQALTGLARHLPDRIKPRLRYIALEAIDRIESEEERADALINFIPNLEYARPNLQYPEMLEKALTITIMIGRSETRARILVALAPHLTPDLQGEALAAIHSLKHERDRAKLLASLVATLPADMLVASLAIAHDMREQDSRVHALSILAHHVPESAKEQTTLDALAAASNLPQKFERVQALVSLLDILPHTLMEQALTNALEATRNIDNENARARALNLLGAYLPQKLLSRALDIALELGNPQQRLNALIGLIQSASSKRQDSITREMLKSAQQIPLEYKRARAYTSIIPYLSDDLLKEIVRLADNMDDAVDRAGIYTQLARQMSGKTQQELAMKTRALMMQIEDGYDRASALAAVAPMLPPDEEKDLARVILQTIRDVEDDYDRASAIVLLTPLLSEENQEEQFGELPDYYTALQRGIEASLAVPQQTIRITLLSEGINLWGQSGNPTLSYALWKRLVARMATLPLPDVLLCLGAVLPLVREFAGDEGLQQITRSLGIK